MQIDKDIPLPPLSIGVRRKHHDLYALIESMQVGDSFLVPERLLYRGVFSNKHLLEKRYSIKLSQRKTSEGLRVWRTA